MVALASTEPQDEIARYLEGRGFKVRSVRAPLGAPREGTLVWLTGHANDDRSVIDTVRTWLGAKAKLRAIIVSHRPVRLEEVREDAGGRVLVLAAPVFGWQLVDALRDEGYAAP